MANGRLAPITRRRALVLGGAAGLGSVVRLAPAVPVAAGSQPSSFGMDVPEGALSSGAVLRAPRRFDLVGLRSDGLAGSGLELRVRRDGGAWSRWVKVGPGNEHAPDRPLRAPASDPVWAGGSDELQLRAHRALTGLRLIFVNVPAAAVPHARAAQVQAFSQAGAATPVIVSRAAWGAAAVPPKAPPSYGAINLAFVHHTESANDYAPEDSARIVLSIAKYHVSHNGWNDIGYNFLVDKYGQVFEGRAGGIDQAVIGAQAGGWNSKSTGIAAIGSYVSVALPEAAESTLAHLIAWKLSLHAVPLSGTVKVASGGGPYNRYKYGTIVTLNRISGHRDGCTTDCPGDVLYRQLPDLRGRVASLGGLYGARPQATLVVASTTVGYGTPANCQGVVSQPDGTPVVGCDVVVQKLGSKGQWVTVAKSTTGADGSWTADVTWRKTGILRVTATIPGPVVVHSPQVTVTAQSVVTVTAPAPRSRVPAPGTILVKGAVSPVGNVAVVIERQLANGSWVAAGRVAAKLKGHDFRANVRLTKPALYRLTARGGTAAHPVAAAAVYVRLLRA